MRLAGAAFADALMVVEFLHTFGDALDLGEQTVIILGMLPGVLSWLGIPSECVYPGQHFPVLLVWESTFCHRNNV